MRRRYRPRRRPQLSRRHCRAAAADSTLATMEVSPPEAAGGAGSGEGARPRAPRARPAPAPSRAARHRHNANSATALAPDSKFKKRKTRRGKSNRWPPNSHQHRRETHAPYNTNQFLMEEHMPEVQRGLQVLHHVESRTRDSSFSVDSDENYFYPLPEDEEEFLTKEFSSVYEDAQSERLTNMTKDELLQEYLLLQGRYDALAKRLMRGEEASSRLDQQEELIRELRATNQALALQLARANRVANHSSSADSESDSSSSCTSSSSSSSNASPRPSTMNGHASPPAQNGILVNGTSHRLPNGEHSSSPVEHPD